MSRIFDEIEKSCWSAGQIFIRDDKKELEERVLQCVPEGASFEEFMRTNFVGTPEDCIKQLRLYVNLGVTILCCFSAIFLT